MMLINEYLGRPVQRFPEPTNGKLVDDTIKIGVEFEYAYVIDDGDAHIPRKIRELYACEKDGSLRNGGYEFKFAKPYMGGDIVEAIDTFFDNKPERWVADKLCGTHIHLDIGDLTQRQTGWLYLMSAAINDYLFELGDCNERKDYNFCRSPWAYTATVNAVFDRLHPNSIPHQFIDREDIFFILYGTNDKLKYTSINPFAVDRGGNPLGTIEYRHFGGISTADNMYDIINVLLRLKQICRMDEEEILSTFYKEFLGHCPSGVKDLIVMAKLKGLLCAV